MPASESSSHATLLLDRAGAILTWNAGCEALFGMQAASTVNHPIGAVLSGDSAAEVALRWPSLRIAGEALRLLPRS
jgi:PAS domain-containing protein